MDAFDPSVGKEEHFFTLTDLELCMLREMKLALSHRIMYYVFSTDGQPVRVHRDSSTPTKEGPSNDFVSPNSIPQDLDLDLNVPVNEMQEEVIMSEVPNDHIVNESKTRVDVEAAIIEPRSEELVE
uniref:Uncharacterized protein n=1 Tax=Tanacetum cinerariifolium TaxID=118510 RepID=A0A6L2MB80_TANCI|nr:hypothetical protein [Tanacetum cinerariifolium]